MKTYLKERIGNPDLFVGRKEEMSFFLNWIEEIKKENSKSTAILARRKMGKTAIMERLFNLTFEKNGSVIPFYYEVKETSMWIQTFSIDFFMTFLYQYVAFKTRKPHYLLPRESVNLEKAKKIVKTEGLDYLVDFIEDVEAAIKTKNTDGLWSIVRNAPRAIAQMQDEFIVQMIDEFQFLTNKIYRDQKKKNLASDMASSKTGSGSDPVWKRTLRTALPILLRDVLLCYTTR